MREVPVKENLSPGGVPANTLFLNALREALGLGPLPHSRRGKKARTVCRKF